jgi:hypothetical protein
MTRENYDQNLSPSRRALLKAAAAGGVFAVPLIASFSMDSASAQTTARSVISSNMVVLGPNMFCGNMTTSVPTASFFAELQRLVSNVPTGPVVGLAGFQFEHDRDELSYELQVNGILSSFTVASTSEFLFEDETTSKAGKIPGSEFDCGPDAIEFIYTAFAAGDATIVVQLANGTFLQGTIVTLDPYGPFQGSFRFVGPV